MSQIRIERNLPPRETADWGHARTPRAVLMAPSAEWIQSVYSTPFTVSGKRLIAPNRDYPYEGLAAHHAGENWRFLDCVAVALRRGDGTFLELEPEPSDAGVRLTPWVATYRYRSSLGGDAGDPAFFPLEVSYYLASRSGPRLATAGIAARSPAAPDGAGDLTLIVQPFFDIRHMYSGSELDGYSVDAAPSLEGGHSVRLGYASRQVTLYLPAGQLQLFDRPERTRWRYKLGTGCRREAPRRDGEGLATMFVPEEREVVAFFHLEVPWARRDDAMRLAIDCGLREETADADRASSRIRRSRDEDAKLLRELLDAFPESRDHEMGEGFLARVVGLTKFKTYIQPAANDEPVAVPHAGAWWFRTPWYRDVFEGLLQSLRTLLRIPAEREEIRRVLMAALRGRDPESGLVPSRLPEFAHNDPLYNSTDATLLCYLTAAAYIRAAEDLEFAVELLPAALDTIARFRRFGESVAGGEGPPRIDPARGLLLSVPHHSWIDTRGRSLRYAGWTLEDLPARVSSRFVKDLYDRLGTKRAVEEALSSPRFFLPEINAQWIAVLEGLVAVAEMVEEAGPRPAAPAEPGDLRGLLERSRSHFHSVFWNASEGFLHNVVEESLEVRDTIECEAAVTAAALLGETVFSRAELEAVWRRAEKRLLVRRRLGRDGGTPAVFGLLCKAEDQRIYYGDEQYHADVMWPRSTPYLIRLLELLGRRDLIREILLTNLDHQMCEGAIFYNQELFSRPCGNNPAPCEATRHDPVPVKNPIQFWSQWCDPYLDWLEADGGGPDAR